MKGYEVHGIRRRTSFENTQNLPMIDITLKKEKIISSLRRYDRYRLHKLFN